MNFINFEGKHILVFGLANRKSIAWFVGKTLEELGAEVYYSVRTESRKNELNKFIDSDKMFVCDVENSANICELAAKIKNKTSKLDGIVHSIAFANFSGDVKRFYETKREDFLQATQISCFSLVEIVKEFKSLLNLNASIVTIGISSQVTAVHYGYMSPIKAALESSVRFLAKSLSEDTEIRVNCVGAGPLKTSASAGIPGFLKNYLFAEKLTLRKKALLTQEVANTIIFLLSDKSTGINGTTLVVNAGMDLNYFEETVIDKAI